MYTQIKVETFLQMYAGSSIASPGGKKLFYTMISMANDTLRSPPLPASIAPSTASHLRIVLTVTHLCLVVLGSVNLLVNTSPSSHLNSLHLGNFRHLYASLHAIHYQCLHDQLVPCRLRLPHKSPDGCRDSAKREKLAVWLIALHYLSRHRNYG